MIVLGFRVSPATHDGGKPTQLHKDRLIGLLARDPRVSPKPYLDADEPYFDLCKAIIIRNLKR